MGYPDLEDQSSISLKPLMISEWSKCILKSSYSKMCWDYFDQIDLVWFQFILSLIYKCLLLQRCVLIIVGLIATLVCNWSVFPLQTQHRQPSWTTDEHIRWGRRLHLGRKRTAGCWKLKDSSRSRAADQVLQKKTKWWPLFDVSWRPCPNVNTTHTHCFLQHLLRQILDILWYIEIKSVKPSIQIVWSTFLTAK